mmetsp:Transcript_56156/g.119414  ORF Transcript_56156/g.119414 Transcript_56156/m.119414 type:complete len:132 (+) Transcript_56156:163-558(+)
MESQALALIDNSAKHQRSPPGASPDIAPSSDQLRRAFPVMNIATISSGFEKGDFLVREEKGQRVYFDFFEEAFNYIAYKGYIRMTGEDEKEWMDTMNIVHASVKGGMKYNTGKLLMVLYKPLAGEEEGYSN